MPQIKLTTKQREIRAGLRIPVEKMDYIKVMAVVDGYVMARYKGCIPFVVSIKKFETDYLTPKFP